MIVPRDIEGQRLLWRWLNSIFGNTSCPEPEPCPTCEPCPEPEPCPTCEPCPEPEPCLKPYLANFDDNVLKFRDRYKAFIRQGRDWGVAGMEPEVWYMKLQHDYRSLQIVREIEYNWSEDEPEYPSIDGFLIVLRNGITSFLGIDPQNRSHYLLREGQLAYYAYNFSWNDDWLLVQWDLRPTVDPPPFSELSEWFVWPGLEVKDVYLCLWNWGYSQYKPDMDRSFSAWLIYWWNKASDRPEVLNV